MYITNEGIINKVKSFKALVIVQEHPGQLHASRGTKGGFTPSVHVRTAKAPCQLNKIHWKKGKKTGNQPIDNPQYIETGEQASVTFIPKMPLYLESFSVSKGLGRIAVMDSNTLIMLGKVTEVEYHVE